MAKLSERVEQDVVVAIGDYDVTIHYKDNQWTEDGPEREVGTEDFFNMLPSYTDDGIEVQIFFVYWTKDNFNLISEYALAKCAYGAKEISITLNPWRYVNPTNELIKEVARVIERWQKAI